jgi:predicted nucleic acid-binding Zn ribbon protein
MGRRLYSRQSNGRFRRATLENTFGLTVDVCPKCRILNPRKVGEAPAENCHSCGAVLRPVSECSHCGERITLLADRWTADDGVTACTDTSAPFVPHKPKEG